MTRVLVVDDQTSQRLSVSMLVEAHPDLTVVGTATHGREAVRMAAGLRPHVVLLDVRTLSTDDVETTRRIVRCSRSGVLFLAGCDVDTYAYAVLRAGAGGLLLRDTLPDELIAGIRAVAAGDAVLSPSLTRKLIDVLRSRPLADSLEQRRRLASLTEREREVLTAVAAGWSNADIAERLNIAPSTVKSHVGRILTKIGAQARVQAVVFAYDTGLVQPRRLRPGPGARPGHGERSLLCGPQAGQNTLVRPCDTGPLTAPRKPARTVSRGRGDLPTPVRLRPA